MQLADDLFSQAMLERMQFLPRDEISAVLCSWGGHIFELLKLMELPCECPVCSAHIDHRDLYELHNNVPWARYNDPSQAAAGPPPPPPPPLPPPPPVPPSAPRRRCRGQEEEEAPVPPWRTRSGGGSSSRSGCSRSRSRSPLLRTYPPPPRPRRPRVVDHVAAQTTEPEAVTPSPKARPKHVLKLLSDKKVGPAQPSHPPPQRLLAMAHGVCGPFHLQREAAKWRSSTRRWATLWCL